MILGNMSRSKKMLDSATESIRILWQEGIFKSPRSFNQIAQILGKRGKNFSKLELGLALKRASYLTRRGKRRSFEYIQRFPAPNRVENIEDQPLPQTLIKKLGKDFSEEISDLSWNFGKSGTCSAFLLRKILEKLIFLTFAKNGLDNKLRNSTGRFIGLESMVNLASAEKIRGIPFLMPKTVENIKGIRFLGDSSAHNPLVNVDMKTIIPQMPFIITAYQELTKRL